MKHTETPQTKAHVYPLGQADDPDASARVAWAGLKGAATRTAETPSAAPEKTAGEEFAELAGEVASALKLDYRSAMLVVTQTCPTLARLYHEERYTQTGEPDRDDSEAAGRALDHLAQEHLRSRNMGPARYAEALRAVCREHPGLARRWAAGS